MAESKSFSYSDLVDLASSQNIRVVDADGLEDNCGLRFSKDGSEYIAISSDLPESEKTRALGYLLESSHEDMPQVSMPQGSSSGRNYTKICSLKCPSS